MQKPLIAPTEATARPPLDGVKVLDLSRILAGPWCTQTLADLGADVWKVESPLGGDDTRGWIPPEIDGESTYFMCANRSKRSISINLKDPDGQKLARRMAAEADILVENFRMGTLGRYGLGYADLCGINPRLIYCSISGYGRTGPRSGEAGYDFAIQAESGLMAITGEPEGKPMKLGVAIVDLVTGMNATQAILAALVGRQVTGLGQFVDIALLDSAVASLANVASGCLATGQPAGRYGNAHATIVPYQTFSSSNGNFVLAVGNDQQFRSLCKDVISLAELADDPRFATNRDRVEHRSALTGILEETFRKRSTSEWITMSKRAGVPVGEVRNVLDVLASPEMVARGLITEVADVKHGKLRLVGSPLGLSQMLARPPTAPPRLGEHTDELLAEILGAEADEIAFWRKRGVVE